MRLSARVDYALRAAAELAAGAANAGLLTAERLASAQQIPPKFLESILLQLRRGGIVTAQRGPEGGYRLARPANEISLAEVIRVIDGPLANVRGARPESVEYAGSASHLAEVWIAVRVSLRSVLERVTLADLVAGVLPASVKELTNDADAWVSRSAGGHTPPPPPRRPPR